MKELISVIVPVYNVEKYLDECLASIAAQTYQNIEVLLVENGSDDRSDSICRKWVKKDRRFALHHMKKEGVSAARNYAFDQCKGQLIGYVDSDDYIACDMYEKLYEAMITTGADISVCTHDKTDADIFLPDCTDQLKVYSSVEFLQLFTKNEEKFSPSIWQRLYKKKTIGRVRFEEGRTYEDILWSAEVILNAEKIAYIDSVLYHYRIRDGSLSEHFLTKKRFVNKAVIRDQIGSYCRLEKLLKGKFSYDFSSSIKMIYLPIVFNSYCSIWYYKIQNLYRYVPQLEKIWNENLPWIKANYRKFTGRNRCVLFLASMPKPVYQLIWYIRQRKDNLIKKVR